MSLSIPANNGERARTTAASSAARAKEFELVKLDPFASLDLALLLVTICTAAACSSSTAPVEQDRRKNSALSFDKHFSPREVEAARKLSLASGDALTNAGSNYARDLRCRNALLRLEDLLRKSGRATTEQLSLLHRAADSFEQRALQQGVQDGMPAAAAQEQLARPSATTANLGDEAGTGLACIRFISGDI